MTSKIEGCNNDGSFTLPNSSGQFICADARYTTGNLGKGWNELDLVPYRITLTAGNAAPSTQTYSIAVGGDGVDGGHPGYDVMSVPVLNPNLSDSSCPAATTTAQQIASLGLGGSDETIYRIWTIPGQAQGSTCVYDYYMRLALGSHLFPGSSLQAYLFNADLSSNGASDVPLPVNQILPQALTKDMTAAQDTNHIWDITKSPNPASVSFPNTCAAGTTRTASVAITVTWTKEPANPNGPINVVSHVYATNPASRVITTDAVDKIYSGTTLLDTVDSGQIDVPANTANFLLLTYTHQFPATDTNLNDVATATYIDKVTGIAVPGNTSVSANATVVPGNEQNKTAVITDTESITGPFQFSVATPSVGSFTGGYTAGTQTTGPVGWSSGTQTDSGSVTFNKTIYVPDATVGSGSLSDTATVTGSDGFTASYPLGVGVSAGATTSLGVAKTLTRPLIDPQVFTFHLFDGSNTDLGQTLTVNYPANTTSEVDSNLITGLSPTGTYYFNEDAEGSFPGQTTASKTFSLVSGDITSCSALIPVVNTPEIVTAQVKKDTLPSGSGGPWTFTLSDNGTVVETLNNVQADAANWSLFSTPLENDGHTYTITEVPSSSQSDFDLTSVVGDVSGSAPTPASRLTTSVGAKTCALSVDLTSDGGKVFECTFTNTERGHIIVQKVTNPSSDTTTEFPFHGSWGGASGSDFNLVGGGSQDSGALVPGNYSVSEGTEPDGWNLTGATCDHGQTPASIDLTAGETVTCTFTNTEQGHIIVKKVTDPSSDTTTQFTFHPSWGSNFPLVGGGQQDSGGLTPGTYTVSELAKTGWDLTSATCDNGDSPASAIHLGAGQTITCTFTNTERGTIKVIKTVNGQTPTGTQSFTFSIRTGASTTSDGTVVDTQTANSGDNWTIAFPDLLVPGTTYQLCEVIPAPGWGNNLPNQFTIPNSGSANTIVCSNFSVTPGQNFVITVDNTPPPGGNAFTIGYWKNHASCSGTGASKTPALDQTLFKAGSGGLTVGAYLTLHGGTTANVSPDCAKAVALLNKSDDVTGKKMASNPLYNLAAQYIAAKLNIIAGASSCPAADSAISTATALFTKYHFTGTGSYALSAADAAAANAAASTLDKYNNNLLC